MIVDVPFLHWATVHRSRKKEPDREAFLSSETVKVDEVDASSAPVAMWWNPPHFGGDHYRPERSLQAAIRAYGGRLYEPVYAKADGEAADRDLVDGAVRRYLTKKADWRPKVLSEAGLAARLAAEPERNHRLSRRPLSEEVRLRSVVIENDRDAEAKKVAAKAARYLLVDGIAYRDVGRPMYSHDTRYRNGLVPCHAVDPDLLWAELVRPEDYEAKVKEFKSAKLPFDPAEIRANAPDVVAPALLAFDQDAWRVVGVGRAVLRALASTNNGSFGQAGVKLASFPRDVIMAYGELRDAVRNDVGTTEVARLLGEFGDRAEPHGLLRDEALACRAAVAKVPHLLEDATTLASLAGP